MKPLNISLDQDSKIRLYFQLYSSIVQKIESGEITEGTRLPSVRVLSQELSISRNTVTKAYDQLEKDGYIISEEKRGYFSCSPKNLQPSKAPQLSAESPADEIPTVDSIISHHKDSLPQIPEWTGITDSLAVPSDEELTISHDSDFQPQIQGDHTLSQNESSSEDDVQELKDPVTETNSLDELPDTPASSYFNHKQKIDPYIKSQETDSAEQNPFIPRSDVSSVSQNPEQISASDLQDSSKTKSLSDLILESYSNILKGPKDALNKFADPFGQQELKIQIASFLREFRNIDSDIENIIISSDIQSLIQKILSLPSVSDSTSQEFYQEELPQVHSQAIKQIQEASSQAQTATEAKEVRGLLKRAETVYHRQDAQESSACIQPAETMQSQPAVLSREVPSQETPAQEPDTESGEKDTQSITPTLAFVEGSCSRPDEVFLGVKMPVKKITSSQKENLLNCNATIAYVSPTDSSIGFIQNINSNRQVLLEWASEKPYRYILEFDTSTENSNNLTFKCYDSADKVIYLSSFSLLISSGINGAWALLPKKLAREYKSMYRNYDCPVSLLDQLFLTDFIKNGSLKQHLKNSSNLEYKI